MQGIDFIALDFETATGKRASICEAGIWYKTVKWLKLNHGWYVLKSHIIVHYVLLVTSMILGAIS